MQDITTEDITTRNITTADIKAEDIHIRAVSEQDTESILEIYGFYVKNTAITFEYKVPLVEEFKERIRTVLEKFPYLAAEYKGQILGYAYADTLKDRDAYNWSVETTIYLREGCRHKGIGTRLYAAMEEMLKRQGILNLYACIAYPDVEDEYLTRGSVLFHEQAGYRIVGRFHKCGCKFNRWYDVVWMEKLIGLHQQHQREIPED